MAEQDAERLNILANNLFQLNLFEEAITKYTSAIQLSASNPVFYANRCQAYLKLEDFGLHSLFVVSFRIISYVRGVTATRTQPLRSRTRAVRLPFGTTT